MKVSDFKLSEYILRLLCQQIGVGFVDIDIVLDTDEQIKLEDNTLFINDTNNWSKTVYQIVSAYTLNIQQITGTSTPVSNEDFHSFTNWALSLIRNFSYSTVAFPEVLPNRSTVLKLNRDPFIWHTMRDIVCPAFDVPLKNIKLVAGKSGRYDGSFILDKREPIVFINLGIENQAVRSAFLLFSVMKCHALDPVLIGRELLSKSELKIPFMGIIKMAFDDQEYIDTFVSMFSILCEYKEANPVSDQKTANWYCGVVKKAQYDPSGWWYLGLYEKLLEPARGADWSGYYTLKSITDELWEKVEAEKKRRGLPNLSMESLLRVQSEEFKQRGDITIQGLLADNRVW